MAKPQSTVASLSCDEPTARRLVDQLAERLNPDDCAVAAFEAGGGKWRLEIYFRSAPDEAAMRALVAETAGEATAAQFDFSSLETADWVAASLANLTPVEAGRFIVHGAHDRAHIPVSRIGIEIEAALAFGTGHHGTTRGCLLALDALAKGRKRSPISDPHPARSFAARHPPPFRGREMKCVLDVGTGSGVLAIAAARRLRRPVTAVDIDPQAVVTARANARLNRAGAFISFARASRCNARFVSERAPYDLILANILLPVLKRMAVPLARLTARGGRIVLSGLLVSHANAALAIYRAQGLALERRITLEGWVTLVLRKA